jgi:hypothetical protein
MLPTLCILTLLAGCAQKSADAPAPTVSGGGNISFNAGAASVALANVNATRGSNITIVAKVVDASGGGYGGGYGGGSGGSSTTYPYLTLTINGTTAGTYTIGMQCSALYQPDFNTALSAGTGSGSGTITLSSVNFTPGGSVTGTFSMVVANTGGSLTLTGGVINCTFSN